MIKLDNKFRMMSGEASPDFSFLNLTGRKGYYNQGYYGQGIIVAVIDTGAAQHPELEDRLLPGANLCQKAYIPNSSDETGHGTHVAGTIAGTNCGIAPQSNILPVKVLNGMGEGTVEDVIKALYYVKDWRDEAGNRVDVINMSLGSDGRYLEADKELFAAFHGAIKAVVDAGISIICAAGNTGSNERIYPGYFDEVIEVGAVDINTNKAWFSTANNQVDVCQMGVEVVSAWYNGGYAYMSGTSMATPIVTGIAALIACKYKTLFGTYIPDMVLYEMLKMNTVDLGIKGVDDTHGAGFCTLSPYNITIKCKADSNELYINEQKIISDAPVRSENQRTLIPFRLYSEALGGYVTWDGVTKYAGMRL